MYDFIFDFLGLIYLKFTNIYKPDVSQMYYLIKELCYFEDAQCLIENRLP